VLRELRRQLTSAQYLYLGDTARLPYGSKSRATIARYAVESARFLVERGAEYLVIACNTASALALDEIRASVDVPVLGVIETGADAALARSSTHDVLVIATTATVTSHAYAAACEDRGMRALEKACPLLVPLIEEGWCTHPVTRQVLGIYLDELATAAEEASMTPDALVLGCTHYPLLRAEIEAASPKSVTVIDSAEVTAAVVTRAFGGWVRDQAGVRPTVHFYATDGVERFRQLGSRFLGEPVEDVRLVDLGG
jgi:glutamate racemase